MPSACHHYLPLSDQTIVVMILSSCFCCDVAAGRSGRPWSCTFSRDFHNIFLSCYSQVLMDWRWWVRLEKTELMSNCPPPAVSLQTPLSHLVSMTNLFYFSSWSIPVGGWSPLKNVCGADGKFNQSWDFFNCRKEWWDNGPLYHAAPLTDSSSFSRRCTLY